MAPSDDLIPTIEAAEIIGRSVPTINRYADEGRLPTAHKLGGLRGARLFRRRDVEALAAEVASTGTPE